LLLGFLNNMLAPSPDQMGLTLPVSGCDETSQQNGFEELVTRNVDFNSITLVSDREENSHSSMDIATTEHLLDKHLTDFLGVGWVVDVAHGTESQDHPVGVWNDTACAEHANHEFGVLVEPFWEKDRMLAFGGMSAEFVADQIPDIVLPTEHRAQHLIS
jgi:hypothetical protein